MNSKTKFTLSITAMVMVTLIAVVSIIAVFAARTQKFSSSISVSYTSHEVVGTASAKWLLGGVEDAQWKDMTNGKNETTLDFSQQLDDPTLSPGQEIPLTEPEQYAIFEYNFTNDAPRPYTLNLTYTDDEIKDENVKVTTCVTSLSDAIDFSGVEEYLQNSDSDGSMAEAAAVDNFTGTIDTVVLANSKLRIYILVRIDNIGADASFSGNFTFNLDGTAISTYDETFTYYTNGEFATLTGVAKGTPVNVGALLRGESFYITMLEGSELTVPEQYNNLDIKTIGTSAFLAQMGLRTIADFGKVETLGNYSFGMSGLSGQLTIPGTVKNIAGAFYQCTNITELEISNGVEILGRQAFDGCTGLSGALIIPESVTTIGHWAFDDCTGLSGTLIIPESVTTIGEQAFCDCTGLSGTLIIPESVTTIGDTAFYGCSGLSGALIIPESVITIGDSAFGNCSSLTSLEIKSRTIGATAFYGCGGLTSLIIGDGVQTIGSYAFVNCDALNEVTIDSKTVCDNLVSWDTRLEYYLKTSGQIKAKYEIKGLLEWTYNSDHFTKSESQDVEGYWLYTKVS